MSRHSATPAQRDADRAKAQDHGHPCFGFGHRRHGNRRCGHIAPGAPATGPMHHYTFEIYALDTTLDLQPGATEQETRTKVMAAMQGHIRGKAVYVGLFRRPPA